jgi:hypothetical protein
MVDGLPFGQPILVGHHSEKRHRNLLERSHNQMGKACELSKQAEELKGRAAIAESNRAISSDNPDALEALKEKVARLEERQGLMKAVNKIVAAKPKNELTAAKLTALEEIGMSEKEALEVFKPDFCGRFGFARFELTNNNAKSKAAKQRIDQLEKAATLKDERVEYEGFALVINTELNRVQIDFTDKATYERLCKAKDVNIRSYGFVFSQRDGNVWQRKITGSAIYQAKQIAKRLTA